jgi:hypothetical protein
LNKEEGPSIGKLKRRYNRETALPWSSAAGAPAPRMAVMERKDADDGDEDGRE